MTAASAPPNTIPARRSALQALDPMVRGEIAAAAGRWLHDQNWSIGLTSYHHHYPRVPAIGGHWTLFAAHVSDTHHEVVTLVVALEFDGERPVDLRVSGALDVIAGGCTAEALREALTECGGPLRQVTPISFDIPFESSVFERDAEPVLAGGP